MHVLSTIITTFVELLELSDHRHDDKNRSGTREVVSRYQAKVHELYRLRARQRGSIEKA
jgi:hypothetical protein